MNSFDEVQKYPNLTLKHLDNALQFYYEHSYWYSYFSELYEHLLKRFDTPMFQGEMIVNKLINDGYVNKDQ